MHGSVKQNRKYFFTNGEAERKKEKTDLASCRSLRVVFDNSDLISCRLFLGGYLGKM